MNPRRTLLKLWVLTSLAVSRGGWAKGSRPLPPGVRKITGEVTINGAAAHEGQVVLDGDTVNTGPRGQVIYAMGTNAFLMRENSQVSHLRDGVTSVLRVINGKILSVFGPGQKRIQVPTATIGIRGTGCYIEAEQDRTYFCLCYGTADISPVADAAQSQQVVTTHHDSPFYIGADASVPLIQRAPVINHRDVELVMLEAEAGRPTPFTQAYTSY